MTAASTSAPASVGDDTSGLEIDVNAFSPQKVQEMLAELGVEMSVADLAGTASNIWDGHH